MIRFQRPGSQPTSATLQMSAMIDIVFLLLVFFVMTFRIVPQEGEFQIDFGTTASQAVQADSQLPLHLRLIADGAGGLSELRLNGSLVSSRAELQRLLVGLADEGVLREQTLLLSCDWGLDYQEVIETLDVVTGTRDEDGSVRPLIEKVKLVSP